MERTRALRAPGYRVIEKWEIKKCEKFCQNKKQEATSTRSSTISNRTVPKWRKPRWQHRLPMKMNTSRYRKFVEELERREKLLCTAAKFVTEDIDLVSGMQRRAIMEWCDQVPVLGFNCGRCGLNPIKKRFAELLADKTAKFQVRKKANKTMFMKTNGFRFLTISSINHLGPLTTTLGTSYAMWVKVYSCSVQKSWLPYEWFHNPEKLGYPGLPDYSAWYSRLKDEYVLSLSEFQECKEIFKLKSMQIARGLVWLIQRSR